MATDAPSPNQDREDVLGPGEIVRPEARRELDPALGHVATSPGEIPPRGWWEVLKRVWEETSSDRMSLMAAGCAFYALLALFPALSVMLSIYGLFLDPATAEAQLHAIRGFLPPEVFDLVAQRVHDLAARGATVLSWNAALGLLIALWSATAGTKSLMMALNIAYEEKEKRGLIHYNLLAIGLTLGGVIGVALALAIIVGLPALLQFVQLGAFTGAIVRVASFLLLVLYVMLGLAVLFRFGPARRQAKWRWITPGSVLATVLWVLVSVLFSFYVANFGSYDTTYGSLGAIVVVLLWFYLSAFVVMLGAELNAELELQTCRDTTAGPERPMGKRGAYVADHVATA